MSGVIRRRGLEKKHRETEKQQEGKARIKIAMVALLVSALIAFISVFFVSAVRE